MIEKIITKKEPTHSRQAELVSASLKPIMCREYKAILKQAQDGVTSSILDPEEKIK